MNMESAGSTQENSHIYIIYFLPEGCIVAGDSILQIWEM